MKSRIFSRLYDGASLFGDKTLVRYLDHCPRKLPFRTFNVRFYVNWFDLSVRFTFDVLENLCFTEEEKTNKLSFFSFPAGKWIVLRGRST
jgi:hypothetical protein